MSHRHIGDSYGQTPFLVVCKWLHIFGSPNYFINDIWKKYTNSNCNTRGFESDNQGNNGLHLMFAIAQQANFGNQLHNLQFILENVFFPKNNTKNKNGIAALKQQNYKGDTPFHAALSIEHNNELAADIVKLLLRYECNVATIYNKQGYLPIHIACIHNNWQALAVLMQKGLYDEHSDDINSETLDKNDNKHTPLELSVMSGYTKCVQILCKNKNIYVDDMSFYNAVESDNSQILKFLLNAILNKHNIYDWKSFDASKCVTIEFLQQIKEFGRSNTQTKETFCVTFLEKLIENGIKKKIMYILHYH